MQVPLGFFVSAYSILSIRKGIQFKLAFFITQLKLAFFGLFSVHIVPSLTIVFKAYDMMKSWLRVSLLNFYCVLYQQGYVIKQQEAQSNLVRNRQEDKSVLVSYKQLKVFDFKIQPANYFPGMLILQTVLKASLFSFNVQVGIHISG